MQLTEYKPIHRVLKCITISHSKIFTKQKYCIKFYRLSVQKSNYCSVQNKQQRRVGVGQDKGSKIKDRKRKLTCGEQQLKTSLESSNGAFLKVLFRLTISLTCTIKIYHLLLFKYVSAKTAQSIFISFLISTILKFSLPHFIVSFS